MSNASASHGQLLGISLVRSVIANAKMTPRGQFSVAVDTKIGFLNQAAYYLSFLPTETTKIILMKQATHPSRKETLAEYYVRINHHLLQEIQVYEMDENSQALNIIGLPIINEPNDQMKSGLISKEVIFSGGVEGGGFDLYKRSFCDGTNDFVTSVSNAMDIDEGDGTEAINKEIRFDSWEQVWGYLLAMPFFVMVPTQVHADYIRPFKDYLAKNGDEVRKVLGTRWDRYMQPRWDVVLNKT